MLSLSVIFFAIKYFEKKIYPLISCHKTLTKWRTKCSQNTHKMLGKNVYLFCLLNLNLRQRTNVNQKPVEMPTKLNLHKTFFWRLERHINMLCTFQKQPSRDVLRKRCSENMQQIYMRTPMPKSSAWVFSFKFSAYFQNIFS